MIMLVLMLNMVMIMVMVIVLLMMLTTIRCVCRPDQLSCSYNSWPTGPNHSPPADEKFHPFEIDPNYLVSCFIVAVF